MNHKSSILIIIIFIAIFISGCQQKPSQESVSPSPSENAIEDGSTEELMKKQFLEFVPDANIIMTTFSDIDSDGKNDLIVLFERLRDSGVYSKSGVGVALGNGASYAVDIAADDTNFEFSDRTDTLSIIDGSVIQVLMQKLDTSSLIRFQVTFLHEKTGFNVKISAEEYSEDTKQEIIVGKK